MAILLAIMFPIPFFLTGYFASRVSFSILLALLVLLGSILLWLFGVPLLGRLLEPVMTHEPNQARGCVISRERSRAVPRRSGGNDSKGIFLLVRS